MTKKAIIRIAFLGVLALSWVGLGLLIHRAYGWIWVDGLFDFYPVNVDDRPFKVVGYYPEGIYLTKQYQKLHIKEMSYEWEGKSKGTAGIFLKDETWDSLFSDEGKGNCINYNFLKGECKYDLPRISDCVRQNVDITKFFKGKKLDDKFKYTVTIVYSLDDEPESTQVIEQNVKKVAGRYKATLLRLVAIMWG